MCYLSYFLKVNVKYLCGNVSYLEGCYVTYFVYDLLLFCRKMRRQKGIFMALLINLHLETDLKKEIHKKVLVLLNKKVGLYIFLIASNMCTANYEKESK